MLFPLGSFAASNFDNVFICIEDSLIPEKKKIRMIGKVKVLVTQLCLTLCDPMDSSLPGSSTHGILQARILEWVACPPLGDLPNPGVEPGFPALQANSSPSSESQFTVGLSNISYIQTEKAQQPMHYRKSSTTLLQQLVLLMIQHCNVKKNTGSEL